MAGRAPSFVVVGLALITFLVGFFYMSCSSKTSELQRTLDDFEGRIRVLTIKNSDKERELETVNNKKRELEQEKVNVRKQIEKKDSEISELNTKLNERLAELRSLKTDKQVLDERLKEYQNASDALAAKNFAIGKLKQEYEERKKSDSERLLRLQQEIDRFGNQSNQSQEGPINFANQRFRPLLPADERSKNTSSLLQEPLAKLNIKKRVSNVLDGGHNPNINQNLPAPPLDNDRRPVARQEPRRADDRDNQIPDKVDTRQRQQRSIDDLNKPLKVVNETEHADNARNISNRSPRVLLNDANVANVANHLDDAASHLSPNGKNYRVAGREESQKGYRHTNDRKQVIATHRQQEVGRGNLL